ncbi:TRAP transporter small permease [Vibrio sp. 404]|uniref:TRAP transporter small permease protein n=1 Tax=Vibrio marinisediminis TaxID=2758441 RepID=A0A7W2FMS0_9VIBR|nr:TRAP transporter small permease [Vibrio marinisediminis]MBA5760894.1 TRAP transporter small permease [Vibrio marinisediminis]
MYKIITKMELVEKYLSIFLFLLMLSVITIQIMSRYFFSFAIPWTEELSRWLYIYIVFVGASEAISRRDHIAVDIVPNRLGNKSGLILDVLIHGLFAVVSLIIVHHGYIFAERMDRLGSITMDVQMSALYGAVPLGFILAFIKSSLNAAISISKLIQPQSGNATVTSHLCK